MASTPRLLIFDIDNTLFDWLPYYAHSNTALLDKLEEISFVPYGVLKREFKQLLGHYGKRNHSFIVDELASVRKKMPKIDQLFLNNICTVACMDAMKDALNPFPEARETLTMIKKRFPDLRIAALTDSPAIEAVWKLTMLEIETFFDSVYGLNVLPLVATAQIAQLQASALQKYRGHIHALPVEYEKPSTKGINLIIKHHGIPDYERDTVIYVGDNLRKDVALGKKAGVFTCWSEFGCGEYSPALQRTLSLSPREKIIQHTPTAEDRRTRPDATLHSFSDLLQYLG